VTVLELKRHLDLQMLFKRKENKVTPLLEELYEYVELALRRDLAQTRKYRIGLDEFYELWQNA